MTANTNTNPIDYAAVDMSEVETMGFTVTHNGNATMTPYTLTTSRGAWGLMANAHNPALLFIIGNVSGKVRGISWWKIIDNKLTPYS